MTQRRERRTRRFAALLALLLALTVLTPTLTLPAEAVKQSDIDALKEDANDLASQRKKLQERINALKSDKSKAIQQKELLDEQVDNTQAEINNVQRQIDTYTALIAQTEDELAEAERQEEAQYELFCARVRAMEERGDISYWAVLFRAESFTDMLSRLDAINELMDSDQAVIDRLQALQEEIKTKQADLEEQKAGVEAAKTELLQKKSELEDQRAEAIALVKEIDDNQAEYQATVDQIKADEQRIEQQVKEMQKKLEEEMAAQGKNYHTNPGGYIWPVDSRYITSTVGGRNSPGGIGSTNHKGTDIGRVGYTSSVYAAKAGTVIISQKSSSYGNYIVISHGSGNTTLYAHLSSRKVSVGDVVQQGQVIGITGSTGHSTGPHLHFEITENGVRINPLSHGAEPKKGYLTGYTLSGTA